MKKNFGPITVTLLLLAVVPSVKAFGDKSDGVEIYHCKASGLATRTKQENPDGLKSFEIGIFEEQKEEIAGRPRVYATGKILDKNEKEGTFYASLVGIPEFLGANMYGAYFTGSYTSNDGQRPEHLLLTSRNDKVGLWRAFITMDNSANGVGSVVRLKRTQLDCKKLKDSIYLER